MAKQKSYYLCTECGYKTSKWMGRCPECESWNTFIEEIETVGDSRKAKSVTDVRPTSIREIVFSEDERFHTGIDEFDRCIGGIVPGQAVLVSGEPGIGKSTLLLQIAHRLSQRKRPDGSAVKVFYVNGEESNSQVKIRASRLGIESDSLFLFAENNVSAVLEQIRRDKPNAVILDSLQTGYLSMYDSLPGSVVQVRECAYELVNLCKAMEIPLFLVSHITKSGNIAGPKIVEHIVDTVLFLEVDRKGYFRFLRSLKNRFYRTDEMGIFKMTEAGLIGEDDVSSAFIWQHNEKTNGICVYPYLEGNRVFPVEIQALCSPTQFNYPKRTAEGLDQNRLMMLIAIMEKKLKMNLFPFDVYVNVTGGLDVNDPALDLSVIFAVYSSFKEKRLGADTAVMGEVGLTGEVRYVIGMEKRVTEMKRLGFSTLILPFHQPNRKTIDEMNLQPIKTIHEGISLLG